MSHVFPYVHRSGMPHAKPKDHLNFVYKRAIASGDVDVIKRTMTRQNHFHFEE